MPDINGILSPSEKQQIGGWLTNKVGLTSGGCPVCSSPKWSIADHVVAPSVVNSTGVGLGLYPYPQAMLISECGYTMYLNLVVVGIFQSGKP